MDRPPVGYYQQPYRSAQFDYDSGLIPPGMASGPYARAIPAQGPEIPYPYDAQIPPVPSGMRPYYEQDLQGVGLPPPSRTRYYIPRSVGAVDFAGPMTASGPMTTSSTDVMRRQGWGAAPDRIPADYYYAPDVNQPLPPSGAIPLSTGIYPSIPGSRPSRIASYQKYGVPVPVGPDPISASRDYLVPPPPPPPLPSQMVPRSARYYDPRRMADGYMDGAQQLPPDFVDNMGAMRIGGGGRDGVGGDGRRVVVYLPHDNQDSGMWRPVGRLSAEDCMRCARS